MANSSYVQSNFLGGEISQAAQGRYDLPSYKISMNVCFNGIPIESGAWLRRPGTRHITIARGGNRGRVMSFAFAQNFPYNMEFTDGFLRFTTGTALVMTNDAQSISAFDTNNPVNLSTPLPHGWSVGQSVALSNLGINNPLLQNRIFTIKTVPNSTTITLKDAITGADIDGATLGAFVSGTISRVLEITTSYINGSWANLRSVQAETRTVLLNGAHPQVLQVASPPTASSFATFTFNSADFIDGPYLDPISGSFVTSSALNGVVTLSFSYQAYDSTRAYSVGDFVTQTGIAYQSLIAPNQSNPPATSPTAWKVVTGGTAINNGQGFVSSDIGRLVRLFSEPALWNAASTYAAGNIVAYPAGNGGNNYWTATTPVNPGFTPGTTSSWALTTNAATWTWAQIISVSGSGLITPATPIGTLGGGGGLAAAFDGNTAKAAASSAFFSVGLITIAAWAPVRWNPGSTCQYLGFEYQNTMLVVPSSPAPSWNGATVYSISSQVQYAGFLYSALKVNAAVPPNTDPSTWQLLAIVSTSPPPAAPWVRIGAIPDVIEDVYIGQHYSVAQAIQSATIWPTTDIGISTAYAPTSSLTIAMFLRGSNSAPTTPKDGTILAQTTIANTNAPITLTSTDNVSAWLYIWVEISANFFQVLPDDGSHLYAAKIGVSQAQFFAPSSSNGSVVTAQIRGGPLLYNQTIRTWRLGVYSDTTGWPPCGTYHEGRIWFGGVVSNRFDACVSNGLSGAQLNFAPTGPDGTVAGNNAISYVCTGEDSNQIEWMTPDQQGILFGTRAGEWLISAPSAGPLAPTNIKAVRVTKIGCANIEPRRAEHTLLIVQKFGRKVVEYFADVFSGKFSAPNLSDRAKHLTVKGIVEIAYQQELAPLLWARRSDGALIGATYKRDTLTTSQGPNIIGWHRHGLGSGRLVESIATGPSQGGNLDALSMVTNDLNTNVRHIEVMTDLLDEGFALTDCWFLDDAIVPSSTVVQAAPTGGPYGSLLVNGLWPHNGKSVSAWIAGLDCGDYTVANGSITVPFGDSQSAGTASGLFTAALVASFTTLPAVIGFNYNSDGQLVRPVTAADTGAQAGPGFAKLGRQSRYAAQLYGVVNGSIAFGTDFVTLDPAKLRFANDVPYTLQQQWSGITRDNINSTLDFDGMIAWRINRPYPCFLMAVGGFTSKADV